MKHVMVRYTVHSGQAEENARLIGEVFEGLKRKAPAGITYSTYRLDDGVSFMHVATLANSDANPLRQLSEFQAFTAGIHDRCAVPPVTTVLQRVGTYPHV